MEKTTLKEKEKSASHSMLLNEKERHLIEVIRSYECGHIEIYIQDYIPLRVVKIKESIIL